MSMFKSRLAIDHVTINNNGKIRLIWAAEISCNVLEADEQQITCEINHVEALGTYITTFVNSKCNDYLRRPLWDKMLHYADTRNDVPWVCGGDFNVITNKEEKLGGIPYNIIKNLEFIGVIEACGLMDLGFSGPKFTLSNQRICKRLEIVMSNKMASRYATH